MFSNFFSKKPDGPQYTVTVSDPQKNGENLSQYISYKLNVSVTENGKSTQSTIIRRYRDFQWLHQNLFALYPGALIPPLPEKAVVGRFTEEFVRERQLGLQGFLNQVLNHKDLSQWKHISTFLLADDETFADAKEIRIEGRSRAATLQAGVMSMVNNVAAAIQGNQYEDEEFTPEELAIDELNNYVTGLEKVIESSSKSYDQLAKYNAESTKQWVALGQACLKLSETEKGDGGDLEVLSELMARMEIGCERAADVNLSSFDQEKVELRRKLKDCVATIKAVKQMIKTQYTRKVSHQQSLTNLKNKQAKLSSGQGTSEQQLAAIDEAKKKVDEEEEELVKVTELCLAEAERFRTEKRATFTLVVEQYASAQNDNQKQLIKAWSALLPCLETKFGHV